MKKYEHVGVGELVITTEIPNWMADWSDWAKELLIPDWTVDIDVSDFPDRTRPTARAMSSFSPEYLSADIVFRRDLEDNTQGHLCVCHEFAHIFLARMGVAERGVVRAGDVAHKMLRGITNYDITQEDFDAQMAVADKGYDIAEEETVVRLARILVGLRQEILGLREELTNGNAQAIEIVDAAADYPERSNRGESSATPTGS